MYSLNKLNFTNQGLIPFSEEIVVDVLAWIDEDDFEFVLKYFEMIHHPMYIIFQNNIFVNIK